MNTKGIRRSKRKIRLLLRHENYVKKVKIEMRRVGKEVVFQDGTFSFLTIYIKHVFT